MAHCFFLQERNTRNSSVQQTSEVGPVNFHVAVDTPLFIVRLVRVHHCRVNAGRIGVALQTQKIDVAVLQHARIRTARCDVACAASLHAHRRVFKHEWSLLVRVALKANHIAGCRGPHLPDQMVTFQGTARSVLVVAIGAQDQPLVYAVTKRQVELRLLLQVAGIAKPGFRFDQHVFFCRRMMHGVAGAAADIVLSME